MEEELINVSEEDFPPQNFKQIESECLNLNITCPGGLTRDSRLPVMLWIHGCVRVFYFYYCLNPNHLSH